MVQSYHFRRCISIVMCDNDYVENSLVVEMLERRLKQEAREKNRHLIPDTSLLFFFHAKFF